MPSAVTPLVYHNNGWAHEILENPGTLPFQVIKKHLFRQRWTFEKPDELEVILCHNYKTPPIAARSLDHLGIGGYAVLGQNIQDWKNFAKLELVLEYLEEHCQSEYVLHLDAADVLVAGDLKLVLDRFATDFSCDVLFNAEKHSAPSSRFKLIRNTDRNCDSGGATNVPWDSADLDRIVRIEDFEKSRYQPPFHYLNSGCYIGRRKALIEILREAISLRGFISTGVIIDDDQVLMREVHRRHYPRIQIDSNCRIFQCMYAAHWWEVKSEFAIGGLNARAYYVSQQIKRKAIKNSKRARTLRSTVKDKTVATRRSLRTLLRSPLRVDVRELRRRTIGPSLLLVTLTNEGYLAYTRNLLASLAKAGLGEKMIVFCIDDASCDALRSEGVHAYRIDYGIASSGFELFHRGKFWDVTLSKLCVIHELLKLDFEVFFVDGDVVFLGNPIPQMLAELDNADLVIQNDDIHYQALRDSQQTDLCTGLLLARPTLDTRRVFNPKRMGKSHACDQTYLNSVKSEVGSVKSLDRDLFPNGSWFLDRPGNDHATRKQQAQIIHFNWRVGDEKFEAMKAHGCWFLNEDVDRP